MGFLNYFSRAVGRSRGDASLTGDRDYRSLYSKEPASYMADGGGCSLCDTNEVLKGKEIYRGFELRCHASKLQFPDHTDVTLYTLCLHPAEAGPEIVAEMQQLVNSDELTQIYGTGVYRLFNQGGRCAIHPHEVVFGLKTSHEERIAQIHQFEKSLIDSFISAKGG